MTKGKFLVIEGPDGSGKTTQFNALFEKVSRKAEVRTIHFPRYEESSSYFVREYLGGKYGALETIGPKKASLFYALDRYDASMKQLAGWIANGETVIVDRYVGSNMGHQGSKIADRTNRLDFFRWLYDLEYGVLGIPKPDMNIILHVPATIAQTLRNGSGKDPDLHERDYDHLQKTERAYVEMAELFKDEFTLIECAPAGKLLSIDEVHKLVWEVARKTLGL